MAKRLAWWVGGVATALVGIPVLGLSTSVGEDGIDAHRLQEAPYNLMGRKIAIGQVEIGRPARFGLDKAAIRDTAVAVSQVLFRGNAANPNEHVDTHAANVASVMISSDKRLRGVAPSAQLYASAVGFLRRSGQPEECLSSQAIALQNGGDVRATNFSFGESLARDPRPNAVLDGNALLTQCIDWSATVHNVLYVIAGNQGRGGIPIPTDNFNGMTVANSTQVNGRFTKIDFSSLGSEPQSIVGRAAGLESNVGPRRSVSLVAPGNGIEMLNPDDTPTQSSGTSFAAPHVTATVALLQEFGDRQLRNRQANWTLDARRHEVMKATMMNAADKVADTGDGLHLGMSRTLLKHNNETWLDSDAYKDPKIPLDADLGTGHLNAYRSYQQFSAGQWGPENPVPAIGWDYGRVAAASTEAPAYQDYVLEDALQAGSFISITLAWNRQVNLQDKNNNDLYDLEEEFQDQGLNNLDLYVMRVEDDNTAQSVWSSVSEVDSVEHIFHKIPETGRYKIRVVYRQRVNQPLQPYALAWWAMPAR